MNEAEVRAEILVPAPSDLQPTVYSLQPDVPASSLMSPINRRLAEAESIRDLSL
jgi:hypothetical protein